LRIHYLGAFVTVWKAVLCAKGSAGN